MAPKKRVDSEEEDEEETTKQESEEEEEEDDEPAKKKQKTNAGKKRATKKAKDDDDDSEEEEDSGKKKRSKKTKKKKHPDEPKRPKNAYFLFLDDKRPEYKKSHPDVKAKDLSSLISAEWSKLTDAEKKPFQDKAGKAAEEYKKKIAEFKKSHPNAGAAEDDDDEEKGSTKKRKRAKKEKDPDAPKKPLSAYMLYCQDNRERVKKENPDLKPKEIVQHLSSEWNSLSDEKKDKFKKSAETLKTKYATDKAAYEAKKKGTPAAAADDDDEDDE